jgi:hypothetical protein
MRYEKYGSAFSALHPLDFSRGAKKEVRLPGAIKNTGDDACFLIPPLSGEG